MDVLRRGQGASDLKSHITLPLTVAGTYCVTSVSYRNLMKEKFLIAIVLNFKRE